MINRRHREKTLHALVYFAKETLYVGKLKLFKLLYLLDFEHYKNTGLSVTGQTYKALDNGPVPQELMDEWDAPKEDFIGSFLKKEKEYPNGWKAQVLEPRVKFNDIFFSEYQLSLMQDLAKEYFRHTSKMMIDETHQKFDLWDEIYTVRGLKYQTIPYELALERRGNERDLALLDLANEYHEFIASHE